MSEVSILFFIVGACMAFGGGRKLTAISVVGYMLLVISSLVFIINLN
jgi:hypothetical protein